MANLEEVQAELAGQKARLCELFNAGQDAAFSQEFTEDCVIMPPGKGALTGRKAVEAICGYYRQTGRVHIEAKVEEVLPAGNDVIVDRGTFTYKDANGQIQDELKWMMVNKNVDGKYLIYLDIFNSSKVK